MFIPKTIDLGESENYVLSIRIKPTEFMFSISEPNIAKNYCLRHTKLSLDQSFLDNIKKIIFDLNFLTQEYKQTNLVIVSPDYNIIPSDYYDENKASELYQSLQIDKFSFILNNKNERTKTTNIFPLDEEIYSFLRRSLFNPVFQHHSSLLMSFFANKNRQNTKHKTVYLNFHDDFLDIIGFEQDEFKHCISYQDNSPQNQIYYILNLWEKMEYSQEDDSLCIYGEPDKSIYPMLKEYIKNIEHTTSPSEVHLWGEEALQAPLDLLKLAL